MWQQLECRKYLNGKRLTAEGLLSNYADSYKTNANEDYIISFLSDGQAFESATTHSVGSQISPVRVQKGTASVEWDLV